MDFLVFIENAVEGPIDTIIDVIHDWLYWRIVISNFPFGNNTGCQGEGWGHYITTWFCNDLKKVKPCEYLQPKHKSYIKCPPEIIPLKNVSQVDYCYLSNCLRKFW